MLPIFDYLSIQSYLQVESIFKKQNTKVLLTACNRSYVSLAKAFLDSNFYFEINVKEKSNK